MRGICVFIQWISKGRICLGCCRKGVCRQKSKLLMRSGGELDEMILGNIEKFPKGGAKKKLGGGTHNTYSGKSKKRK